MKRIAVTLILLALPTAAAFAADAAAGKAVYDSKCKMCHGAEGAGGAMDKASIAGTPEAATKPRSPAAKAR